jgi:hypothetical protein
MWYDLKVLEDSINCLYDIIKANAITFSCWSKIQVNNFLKSPRVQTIAIYAIIFIGRIEAKTYLLLKRIYDQNELIRVPTDFILWTYETIGVMNVRHRQEPTSKCWLNVCSSTRLNRGVHIGKTPYNFSESYNKMNDIIDKDDIIQAFEIALDNNSEFAEENKEFMDDDTIVLMKWNEFYKVSRITKPVKPQVYDFEASGVRFLSVEYTIPESDISVCLKIPREMYVQGNELFSHAFVRRLLEYQSEPTEFGFNYKLKIVDGDVNEIELNYKQYIVLGKNSYEVITVE